MAAAKETNKSLAPSQQLDSDVETLIKWQRSERQLNNAPADLPALQLENVFMPQ